MSVYDTKELMTMKAASREFDVPVTTLEMAIGRGTLRVVEQEGLKWLFPADVEQLVKRTVKQGEGNRVVSRFRR